MEAFVIVAVVLAVILALALAGTGRRPKRRPWVQPERLAGQEARRRLMQLAIELQQTLLDWECEDLSALSSSPAWDAADDGPELPFGHPGRDFDDPPPGAARELADPQ